MLSTRLLSLVTVSILAGCTTQPKKVSTAANDVQCHADSVTGTLIHKTVCLTKADRDAQQAANDDLKERQVGNNPGALSRH